MLIYVGKVERIVAGKVERVCACCNIACKFCQCEHDQDYWGTKCIYRRSTY